MDPKHTLPAKRKPAIGVMVGSFHTDYSRLLVRAISHTLEAEADVALYQGFDAARFLSLDPYVNENFDGHYYSQFEYAKFLRTDLLIVSFGTISAVNRALTLESFLAAMPKVPVILIEDTRRRENTWFVSVDNYSGMRQCVEHLISVHGCRCILFIAGPGEVHDAELRLRAYCDAMREHGLELDDDMIGQGNFTDHVEDAVEKLLARYPRPDAIVCANDEMAESAYRVLAAHGLRPGIDVAVTGFDDNVAAAFLDPPLTTVRQPKWAIAEAVASLARAILRGEKPEPVILQTEFICRCSCGCRNLGVAPEDEETARGGVFEVERRYHKLLTRQSLLSALVLRNLLREDISVHRFFRYLGQSLQSLGLERAWVGLLKEPLFIDRRSRLFLPGELRLHMAQNGGETRVWSRQDAPVIRAFSPEGLDPEIGQGHAATVFPLFYGNQHYGVFIAAFPERERLFYYTLSLELGTGLRYLYMALAEHEARAALEEKNHILDFSASHDALTGLYNRVGVMNEVYSSVRAGGKKGRYVAVMADLDHLKEINDTFGHSGGDAAIRRAAELLRCALPEDGVLGRIGGDEFVAVFTEREDFGAAEFQTLLRTLCRDCDETDELPFFLGITTGCCGFDCSEGLNIPLVLKRADEQLYENKRFRRRSVIKLS